MNTLIRIARTIVAPIACLVLTTTNASGADSPAPPISHLRAMNYVVVSPNGPDDGGDFGPHTPSTKTSGIQEAFNTAKANRKDVYIAGGTMPETAKGGVVYHTQETIHIPWFQDFRLDGGEYVINYDRKDGDAVVVDSQMSCRLKFGLIVSPSDGVVVRLKPETKGPDGFAVITCSTFEFNAIVGAGSVFPDGKQSPKGTGLFLDASVAPILHNKIYVTEIIACEIGLMMSCGPNGNPSTVVSENTLEIPFLHLCGTHMQVGNAASNVYRNVIHASVNSENLSGATGVRIFGKRNLFTLDVQTAAKNRGIVFEAPAEDNRISMLGLPAGYTNDARRPTNKIIPLETVGFAVDTPAFPPSEAPLMNRNPYAVEVLIISPGAVTAWSIADANGKSQSFASALTSGQSILLEPGDSVSFTYAQAPSWRWRAR